MYYTDTSKTVYMETNRLLQASTQISATSRCKNFRFFSTISRNYEYEFQVRTSKMYHRYISRSAVCRFTVV